MPCIKSRHGMILVYETTFTVHGLAYCVSNTCRTIFLLSVAVPCYQLIIITNQIEKFRLNNVWGSGKIFSFYMGTQNGSKLEN